MGSIVRFLAPDTDAFVASVQRHIVEFEKETGHAAELKIIGSDLYFSNKIHPFLDGAEAADVYMSGPVLLWEHLAAGCVEPLDDYLLAADSTWDAKDFFDSVMRANRWTGRFGDKLGTGPLLDVPVNCESYNLACVPEILDRCGVEIPSTWEGYFAAARTIVEKTGPSVRGFGQRGIDVWHTMYTGYATQFWSYGATDFDDSRRCAIASAAGIRATRDFIDALKAAGPRDWTRQRWYELALDFAHGRYGLLVDSDHYVAYFESMEHSSQVGRIGYALPPAGPDGQRRPNLWTWSLVMNARSTRKQAAWAFIQWASSRSFLLRSAFEGNMNPTRRSVWNDDSFVRHTRPWGSFYTVSRKLVEELGSVLVTPSVNYLGIASRWTRALRDAYTGKDTVKNALAGAARDIDDLRS